MTEKELRGKIKHEIEFLAEHWTTDDVEPFNFGGWKEEVLDEIMQLIHQGDGELIGILERKIKPEALREYSKSISYRAARRESIKECIQLVQQQGDTFINVGTEDSCACHCHCKIRPCEHLVESSIRKDCIHCNPTEEESR